MQGGSFLSHHGTKLSVVSKYVTHIAEVQKYNYLNSLAI
jgi:hypothetical protein